MNVNPSSPKGPRTGDPASLEAQRAQEARPDSANSTAGKAAQPARPDSVDVSAEAKALAEGADAPPRTGLSAERLKEISERLANNYYDRPEVIETVAQRLAADPNFKFESGR